ncbi:MAG: hypothetical protein HUU15_09355 [Candidatus Brocadiae bacterium]|nr:hypothetical protein [Candidatus Brocadiia bacterium]
MKTLLSAAVLLALALPAHAEDRVWALEEGRTWTWICTSEFHYNAIPITATVDGQTVRRGGNGGWSSGSGSGRSSNPGRSSDPQWETIVLRGTVIGTTPQGNARVEFFVVDAAIEVRFDSNGDHAAWDSRLSRTTDIPGFKKYEAILGARFEAHISPSGAIVAVVDDAWPLPEPIATPAPPTAAQAARPLTKAERARAREVSAAEAAHDPTAAEAWVNMIFGLTPAAAAKSARDVRLPDYERLEATFGGKEPIGRISCVRTKFKSAETQPADPRPAADLNAANDRIVRVAARTLEQVSMDMLLAAEKKGHSWFSREHGCMLKSEMDARSTTAMGGTLVTASFLMETSMKSVGKTGPVATCEPPKDLPVTDFTETRPGSSAR